MLMAYNNQLYKLNWKIILWTLVIAQVCSIPTVPKEKEATTIHLASYSPVSPMSIVIAYI